MTHSVLITPDNPALSDLKLSWKTAIFTDEDGIGPLNHLHEAGDAFVAIARMGEQGFTVLGSGIMIGPGLLLTATHVLDEFPRAGAGPVFLTFLPNGARAWLPIDHVTLSKPSEFDESRKITSDMSLVSCTLNSEAHADFPLMLAPIQIGLPLIGERLWTIGFRHQVIENRATLVTPLISSGLVTAAYPEGRGERMASPCFEVNMDTIGGMSGGAVVNADGDLVGILSSSFEGGPSYVTLAWEAIRLRVKGAIPKLQATETINLLTAKSLGQVRLKGNVQRNPWGDVTLRLSDEENKLLIDSLPAAKTKESKPTWSNEQCEQFIEECGRELESLGSEATITTLNQLSLARMRDILGVLDIPNHCLNAIESFSVEDFEGVEDLELISTEVLDDGQIRIEYFFELQMLIWAVDVQQDAYSQHSSDFQKYFINVSVEDRISSMEIIQRGHFRAVTQYDPESQEFSHVSIISCAIKKPKKARN